MLRSAPRKFPTLKPFITLYNPSFRNLKKILVWNIGISYKSTSIEANIHRAFDNLQKGKSLTEQKYNQRHSSRTGLLFLTLICVFIQVLVADSSKQSSIPRFRNTFPGASLFCFQAKRKRRSPRSWRVVCLHFLLPLTSLEDQTPAAIQGRHHIFRALFAIFCLLPVSSESSVKPLSILNRHHRKATTRR